jgi:hypothetical protein
VRPMSLQDKYFVISEILGIVQRGKDFDCSESGTMCPKVDALQSAFVDGSPHPLLFAKDGAPWLLLIHLIVDGLNLQV